jgi:glycogen(starch) synthase
LTGGGPAQPGRAELEVLRLCSVFEAPAATLAAGGAAYDPVGGMQSHTGQLTRTLDACGVAQTVVTAWRPGAARRERLGSRSQVLRVGAPVRRLRQLYAPTAAPLLPGLAATADLIHVHLGEDLAVVPLGLLASRRRRPPLVLTVHCSLRHTLQASGARGLALSSVGAALEVVGERRADAVIALTPRLADLLVAGGLDPDRVHVIPSGVDLRRFTHRLPDPAPDLPRPRVLFVGRLAAQKGVATLLDAVPLLRGNATVVLVGDGPQRRALERQAGRLGPDRVRFQGFVAHTEVPAWLAAADVLVLPSIYEELGSVLLEAMAAGLPVVASAVGGIPDALGDAGRLVPPRDPAALAAAVDELLDHPALAAQLGDAARRRATAFSWDVLAGRVLDVYRQVVGRR